MWGNMTNAVFRKVQQSQESQVGQDPCDPGYYVQVNNNQGKHPEEVVMNATTVGMKSVVVIASVILASGALAQPYPYIEWTRTYGGTGDDVGKSIQITEDGGYIIGGYTKSFGAQGYDMYLIRTDEWGDTLWTRRYGDGFDQRCNSVQITSDGGYMISGSTASYLYILRTNSAGDLLWTRTYANCSGANSIHSTNDGGYVIAGGSYIMKTNADGDSLWTRTVTGGANCAKQTYDGGYLVAGSRGVAAGLAYVHATKFSINGAFQWERDYYYYSQNSGGYSSWNLAYDFVQTPNSEFIIVGTTGYSYYQAPWWEEVYEYYYIVKTTANGVALSHQLHSANGYICAFAVCITQNGGNAIVGGFSPYDHLGEYSNFYLLKKSSGMTTEWATTYGGAVAYDIAQTADRGYILVGESGPYGSPNDVYLVKTGPDEPVIRPNIEVSASLLNFGEVPAGVQAGLPLTIRSNGDTTLTIWGITTDDSCYTTNFNPAGGLIESGDSLVVTVFFTPEEAIAYNNKHLTINNNDEQVTVTMNGVGTSCISTSPDSLNFGIIHQGYQSTESLMVHNNCDFAVVMHAINSSNAGFFANFNPADSLILPHDSLNVTVFFSPQDSGIYNGTLTILSSNGTDTVHLYGIGIPCILAVPNYLGFGVIYQGNVSYSSFMIINECDTMVILRNIVSSETSFSVSYDITDSLLLPHDSLRVAAMFCPHDNIVYQEDLGIESSMGFQEVNLFGTGIHGFSAPTWLNFGYVNVGQWQQQFLCVHNISDTSLAIYNITTNDSVYVVFFNPADSLIEAGDSLRISVWFRPVSNIWYIDTLTYFGRYEEGVVQLRGCGHSLNIFEEKYSGIPKVFALPEPYPNPFNIVAAIRYDVPVNSQLILIAYDVLGRKVAELVNGETEPGYHSVVWDASGLPSGIYFVRMEAGEFVQTRKVVLLK